MPVPQGDQTATPRQALLVQPLSPIGGAVLDGGVSTGIFINPLRLAAGSSLFLAQFAVGDAYCAVAVPGLFTICLMDSIGAGRFDRIGVSGLLPASRGAPRGFNGMALIAFPPKEFKPLETPVAYHLPAPTQPPQTTIELRWAPWRGPAKSNIAVGIGFRSGNLFEVLNSQDTIALNEGRSTVFTFAGATIEVVSLADRVLTYRVLSVAPTHVDSIKASFGQGDIHLVP